MNFPFVSRERFDEERARAVKAEDALEVLRLKFLEYLERHPATPLTIGEDTNLGLIQPIQGRATIANVIEIANRDAYKAAQVPGAKGIADQVREAQSKMMRIKREANGG